MIVIGADTHKSTHALAAVDADTGQLLGERQMAADEQGHLDAVKWARELGREITWAIEDCRHVSQRLERSVVLCTSSRSRAGGSILPHAPTSLARKPRARAASRRCIALSATSLATTVGSCSVPQAPADATRALRATAASGVPCLT
jgi:hypothetical protein